MFAVSFGNVCLCLFLQLVTGRSLDLPYGYQEIENSVPQKYQEEVKVLEFGRISDDVIEEICKNFKVTIHIKEPESFINCLEPIFDRGRSGIFMKRDAEEIEGSGDIDVPVTSNTADQKSEGTIDLQNTSENSSEPHEELAPENQSTTVEEILVSFEKPESPKDTVAPSVSEKATDQNSEGCTDSAPNTSENASNVGQTPEVQSKPVGLTLDLSEKKESPSGNPGSFQSGFEHILKNIPRELSNSTNERENSNEVSKTSPTNGQINVKPDITSSVGEEANTGESQEQPTTASHNNMLLIVIAGLGVMGALAFAYNFVKSRRESQEIDEVVRLETEGRELKEMKPLMRSPLIQNGAKSMEYIDADPQIQVPTETRVEVIRDHNSE